MITLYNYELDDNCYKVRLGLALLGCEWETVAVDVYPGREHLTEAFLAMSPAGRLPILRDGDVTLHGAEAILAHLARACDGTGRWLPFGDGFSQTMQWLIFAASDAQAVSKARQSSLFGSEGDSVSRRDQALKILEIMEDHMLAQQLDGREWIAATHPTIADIALFPAFALSRDIGIDHDEYPALRRWARRFRKLPGFRTMPGIPDFS